MTKISIEETLACFDFTAKDSGVATVVREEHDVITMLSRI
jgi:hypothetical protein